MEYSVQNNATLVDILSVRVYLYEHGHEIALMSPMGSRSNPMQNRHPIGTTASTGERCPESGVWKSLDAPSTIAPIAKSNVMPPHNGRAVSWKLTQYA